MASFLQVTGIAALAKAFQDSIDAARFPGEYWVGSAVPYGPFHEFGTTRIAARPHWSPAIFIVAQKNGIKGDELVNEMITVPRGLVKRIAFEVEREVKGMITTQGVIDTGNYRGSIATGPSESEAFGASAAKATI